MQNRKIQVVPVPSARKNRLPPAYLGSIFFDHPAPLNLAVGRLAS
jgi:hypothetical protein